MDGKSYDTLAQAQVAGAPTLNIGIFLTEVIDFNYGVYNIYDDQYYEYVIS